MNTGFFPTLLIFSFQPYSEFTTQESPHLKKDLPSCLSFLGLKMSQNTFGGGEDGKPYFSSHLVQLFFICIDPKAGLADPTKSRDKAVILVIIFQEDAQKILFVIFHLHEVADEVVFQKQLSDPLLHHRGGEIHLLVFGLTGVSYSGQHISQRISGLHEIFLPYINCGLKSFLILNLALFLLFSPTGFYHPGDLPFKRQFSEADAAQPKIPHKTPRPSTTITSIVLAHAKFRFPLGFFNQTRLSQLISLNSEFRFTSLKQSNYSVSQTSFIL
jgi:hypothetical protein